MRSSFFGQEPHSAKGKHNVRIWPHKHNLPNRYLLAILTVPPQYTFLAFNWQWQVPFKWRLFSSNNSALFTCSLFSSERPKRVVRGPEPRPSQLPRICLRSADLLANRGALRNHWTGCESTNRSRRDWNLLGNDQSELGGHPEPQLQGPISNGLRIRLWRQARLG